MPALDLLLTAADKRDPAPVRPSCAERIRTRNALVSILPGYSQRIRGYRVTRTERWRECSYKVGGMELMLDEAIDLLMGGERADWLRATKAPPPRAFVSVLGSVGDVERIQMELFRGAM